MDNQKIQLFINEYKSGLQTKVSKSIVYGTMMFFVIFVFIEFLITLLMIDRRTDSQFSYLQTIGRAIVLKKQLEVGKVLNFLDSSSRFINTGMFIKSSLSACNNQQFLCKISVAANFSSFNSIYSVILANSQMLTNNRQIAAIFLFNNHSKVFFNQSKLGLVGNNFNKTLIQAFITKYNNNPSLFYQLVNSQSLFTNSSSSNTLDTYIYALTPINSTISYLIFCEVAIISSLNMNLCVAILSNNFGSVAPPLQNKFYVTSDFTVVDTGIQTKNIIDWIQIKYGSKISNDDVLSCMKNSANLLSNFQNSGLGKVVQCKPNATLLFDILGPYFPYVYFQINLDVIVATSKYKSLFISPQNTISCYISSNATYHQQINHIIKDLANSIRYTGYALVAFLAVTLFVITLPNELVQNTITESLMLIYNLYEHLRRNQQKQFNNLYVKQKPKIFSFIADFLNKYLWIYKLIKSNKQKSIYKKLLLQGIDLFGEKDLPVKKYIYYELIRLQNILIQKYNKVRELPTKKKTSSKLQFPIIEPKIIYQAEKAAVKRRFANMHLLNPDDDELMKNISVSFKGNRGVRFSNDIQTIQIDRGPILRKTKFSEVSAQSCETIKNDLSEAEIQSFKIGDLNKDSIKSLKQEDESYTSLIDLSRSKKKESMRSRGLQSVHGDLQNMRLDEQDQSQLYQLQKNEQQQYYQLSRQALTDQIANTYHRTVQFYEELIRLKVRQSENQREDELLTSVNAIYQLTLQKYEFLARMLAFQNQMHLPYDENQREEIAEFRDLAQLERNHATLIRYEYTQRAEIVKLQIHQALQLPVSFRTLEYLGRSGQKNVRISARRLLAEMAENLSPHLDAVLMKNIQLSLDELTTCTQKRALLMLLTRTLQRYYAMFPEEIAELRQVRQFYNKNNKKIYFIGSIVNPKSFSELLGKFYQYIQPFDMVSVYNLDEDTVQFFQQQISQQFISKKMKRMRADRIKFMLNQDDFLQLFNFPAEKIKENPHQDKQTTSNSTKTISKKRVYQREFYDILNNIQADDTQFSKYLVVLLGQEHNNYSGQTDESSSSANHRPQQQKIHQQITKIVDKGYYHIVLAGHQLGLYPSKYGRLKKYLKLSSEVFQIDLGQKDQEENFKMLEKYLN